MSRHPPAHEDPGRPAAPRTVSFLRGLGHDIVRVTELLHATAADLEIVRLAMTEDRVISTQDLDFSAIVALSGASNPSVNSVHLVSANVDEVNMALALLLPGILEALRTGAFVSVEQDSIRVRRLPME